MATQPSRKRQRLPEDQANTVSPTINHGPPVIFTYAPRTGLLPIYPNDLWDSICSLPEMNMREMLFHVALGSTTMPLLQQHLHNVYHGRMREVTEETLLSRQAPAIVAQTPAATARSPIAVAEAPVVAAQVAVTVPYTAGESETELEWDDSASDARPRRRFFGGTIDFLEEVEGIESLILDGSWDYDPNRRHASSLAKEQAQTLVRQTIWPKIKELRKKATEASAHFDTKYSALKVMIGIADAICTYHDDMFGRHVVKYFCGENDDISKNMMKVLESMSEKAKKKARNYDPNLEIRTYDPQFSVEQLDMEIDRVCERAAEISFSGQTAFLRLKQVLGVLGKSYCPTAPLSPQSMVDSESTDRE